MGGLKTKGRGKDKKKRKPRKTVVTKPVKEPEIKPNIIRNIIHIMSEKLKKPEPESWSLDIDPPVRSMMLGRHVFKREGFVEIDLRKL
jgi:hypothetical protein